jgi:hypothetical protein
LSLCIRIQLRAKGTAFNVINLVLGQLGSST